jgi:hypothetical protein
MNGSHRIGTLLAAGALSLWMLTGAGCAWGWHEHERDEKPAYASSVQVTGAVEADRGDHEHQHEAAALAKIAKVDMAQAISAAATQVPGKVLSARIENEAGNVVYAVEILTGTIETKEVVVDAGNGAVLQVSDARRHCEEH